MQVGVKYFSNFYISYRRRILTRKEIDDMELVIEWLLFVLGEDAPLETAPASGG